MCFLAWRVHPGENETTKYNRNIPSVLDSVAIYHEPKTPSVKSFKEVEKKEAF